MVGNDFTASKVHRASIRASLIFKGDVGIRSKACVAITGISYLGRGIAAFRIVFKVANREVVAHRVTDFIDRPESHRSFALGFYL